MTTQQHSNGTLIDRNSKIEAETRTWISDFVISLNLCPFAESVRDRSGIRVHCYNGTDLEQCLKVLASELLDLAEKDDFHTTLLVLAHSFSDFDEFLDLAAMADGLLEQLDLVGQIQIATFHPNYQFDGEPADDPANYTNRSPYPMLHLLRESAVAKAVAHYPDVESIPERNIEKLRELGKAGNLCSIAQKAASSDTDKTQKKS